jgi:hypothetical protein
MNQQFWFIFVIIVETLVFSVALVALYVMREREIQHIWDTVMNFIQRNVGK